MIHARVLLVLLLVLGYCNGKAADVVKPKTGPISSFTSLIRANAHHLLAAASARATSITLMYPVDTIKTRLQMSQPLALKGLFSGLTSSLIGQVPYGVLTFGSYEIYKQKITDKFPNLPILPATCVSAVLGDLTGSVWLCPSEVIKQNIQGGNFKTTRSAVVNILKKDGLTGFYRGYFGGVVRDVPFRVLSLGSYEVVKKRYVDMKERAGKPADLTSGEAALVGAFAGSFAALTTTPLDKMKTSLMTGQSQGSYLEACRTVMEREGPGAFFQGVVPRVGLIGPSVAIFFVVYEKTKQVILREQGKK
ncbi:hypothetical protein TrVE_jg8597 [Triparma verrucosa]|uniref:Mitochondrial carrier protein n=1 Tax=Triparma verrucosa TaxID=1606542 RepID=A0A9W7FG64_9STRA|nr:hypothetical protein TrVE_jg8597 [Triparma verrucosa]